MSMQIYNNSIVSSKLLDLDNSKRIAGIKKRNFYLFSAIILGTMATLQLGSRSSESPQVLGMALTSTKSSQFNKEPINRTPNSKLEHDQFRASVDFGCKSLGKNMEEIANKILSENRPLDILSITPRDAVLFTDAEMKKIGNKLLKCGFHPDKTKDKRMAEVADRYRKATDAIKEWREVVETNKADRLKEYIVDKRPISKERSKEWSARGFGHSFVMSLFDWIYNSAGVLYPEELLPFEASSIK